MSFFKDDVKFTSMTEPFDSEMNKKLHHVLSKIQPGLDWLELIGWLTGLILKLRLR